jgi:hypothetical protein
MFNAKSKTAKKRARKRTKEDRQLLFEVDQLERRRMLAGDVTAVVAGGSLSIEGDAEDNLLAMTQVNGELVLIGFDTAIEDADMSTNLLGIDIDVKLLDGVTKDVKARLGEGNDVFLVGGSLEGLDLANLFASEGATFGPAEFLRDLRISTDGGNDLVVVTGAEVGRHLKIDTGSGEADTVVVGGGGVALAILDALEDLDVVTASELGFDGGGEVIGEIINALLGPVTVGRNLEIVGGSSSDSVYVGGADIGHNLRIKTGAGDDEVYVGTGAVIEICEICDPQSTSGHVGSWLGEIEVSSFVNVGRDTRISTRDGNDEVRIGGADHFEFFCEHDGSDHDGGHQGGLVFVIDGGVEVEKSVVLNTGKHDDDVYIGVKPRFDAPHAESGPKGDGVDADVYVGRDLRIKTDDGDDVVKLSHLEVGKDLKIDTGRDDDVVVIKDFFDDANGRDEDLNSVAIHGRTRVSTGKGEDRLIVKDVSLSSRVDVKMGSGDDFVLINTRGVSGDFERIKLDGGRDYDTLKVIGSLDFLPDTVEVKNFEDIIEVV